MGILNTQIANNSNGSVVGMTTHPTNIEILINGSRVGMIQSFSPSESRNVTPIMALGVEGVVTSSVGNYSGGTFSTPMIEIYDQTSLAALGVVDQGGRDPGGLRQLTISKALYQQRIPVDIRAVTYTPAIGAETIDTFVNCYITSYSKSISISASTISVGVSWRYERWI
jgi:hypothetical protein